MGSTRTRARRAADVWLDDTLWAEPQRSREIELDAVPAPEEAHDGPILDDGEAGIDARTGAFYDHEVDTGGSRGARDSRGAHPRRRTAGPPTRRVSGPRAEPLDARAEASSAGVDAAPRDRVAEPHAGGAPAEVAPDGRLSGRRADRRTRTVEQVHAEQDAYLDAVLDEDEDHVPPPPPPLAPIVEQQGEVPGILRRPLVEVQRSLPVEPRESGRRQPDRVALWAVALAVVTLLAAILTASGSS